MRERITYVQKLGDSLEPSSVTVKPDSISGPEVNAVREDRLTIAFHELPSELQTLIRDVRDLHVRWVSTTPYESVDPLLARLPPGFHVLLSPPNEAPEKLCPALRKIFGGISCILSESFTSLPKNGFQYYQQLDSLSHFIQYAKDQLCRATDTSCFARLDDLSRASSLDISTDPVLEVLKITAVWPYQRQPVLATSRPKIRTEVGILSNDKPQTLEQHELGISGILTVLGQDSKPSPTMFTFASRHRNAESTFSAQFLTPTGLHPILQLHLSSPNPPPLSSSENDSTSCSPYAYITLPRTIFADKYQLADPLFLASKNLTSLRHITQPVDLEAPEYVMPQWGSSILVQLSPPGIGPHSSQTGEPSEWTAQIPLHLRYLTPTSGGHSTIQVPYPAVFWACEPQEGVNFPPNPFEKGRVGYDALFEEGTVFWHVEPRPADGSSRLVNEVRVPVLDLDRAGWVNAGTAAAVMLGFAWVVWKLLGVWWREGYGARAEGRGVEVKKRQ
ncbi:hypothetical protein VTI74DRAFT_3272 [Chaetomium olivicolor]